VRWVSGDLGSVNIPIAFRLLLSARAFMFDVPRRFDECLVAHETLWNARGITDM
jgi:hypothetical protein